MPCSKRAWTPILIGPFIRALEPPRSQCLAAAQQATDPSWRAFGTACHSARCLTAIGAEG
jgi:hypothetical protein